MRPRVHRTGSTVPLLLEEEIRQLLDSGQRVEVRLCGARGLGKTTALAHLAAVFAGDSRLALRDLLDTSKPGEELVTVVASRRDGPEDALRFHLLPWTDDDVLEYLLATHPDRIATAFSAWQVEATHDLHLWPGICRRVLDVLATQPIGDPLTALSIVLRQHFGPRHDAAVDHALRTFVVAETPCRRVDAPPAILEGERHVLASAAALGVLAAERVLDVALGQPRRFRARISWRPPLRVAILHKLQGEPELEARLRALAGSRRVRHKAFVMSCLCSRQPGHRPAFAPRGDLAHAWLRGIDLSGMRVRARLEHADLDGADLRQAVLHRCNLAHASLRGARAELLECSHLHAPFLRAAGLDARGSRWPAAHLADADLRGARLEGARFPCAQLSRAQLQGALLHEADLSRAQLGGAMLGGTDLQHACCEGTQLGEIDLRETRMSGATFCLATFRHCNLAGSELPGLYAPQARFLGSDLTASKWRGANLERAVFDGSGLADVDWEGADLRAADFRRATFHLGNARSGLVDSTIPGEGSRTGFYTDESLDDHFRAPEEVRKANLRRCDMRGAIVEGTDFYLVDVRGARLEPEQRDWLKRCRAILDRE